jgi:hypothetical protein
MQQVQLHHGDQLRKAIGKLVVGLEKRNRELHERRRHNRYSFGVRVNLCIAKDDEGYETLCEAWAVDISVGGIGLLITQNIKIQDVYYVSFEQVLDLPRYIPMRLKHARMLFGDICQIHGEFVYSEGRLPEETSQIDEA